MAPSRQEVIAQSIQHALLHHGQSPSFLARLPAYFYTSWLTFARVREDLFTDLRQTWKIDQDEYLNSFASEGALVAMVRPTHSPTLEGANEPRCWTMIRL